MREYDDGAGWTEVRYRHGRLDRRGGGQTQNTSYHRHHSPQYGSSRSGPGQRPLYASVTRIRREDDRDDTSRRRPFAQGYKPQFLATRAPYGPRKNNPSKHKQFTQTHLNKKYMTNNNRNMYDKNNDKNKQRNKEDQSDDPDFIQKKRVIYTIIKTVHHLKNVSASDPPRSIARMGQKLADNIRPAAPTAHTKALIEGNAKKLGIHYNADPQGAL